MALSWMLRKSVGVLRSIELQNNVGGDCAATDTLTGVSRILSPVRMGLNSKRERDHTVLLYYYPGRMIHIMFFFIYFEKVSVYNIHSVTVNV